MASKTHVDVVNERRLRPIYGNETERPSNWSARCCLGDDVALAGEEVM